MSTIARQIAGHFFDVEPDELGEIEDGFTLNDENTYIFKGLCLERSKTDEDENKRFTFRDGSSLLNKICDCGAGTSWTLWGPTGPR